MIAPEPRATDERPRVPDTTDSTPVVVVGLDGSANARAALAWASEEAVHRSCQLRVITAWTPPSPRTTGDAGPSGSLPDLTSYQESAQRLVDDMIATVGHPENTVCEAIRGDPVEILLDAGRNARMLVLGASGGGQLGSVAQQLAHHAPCPVLIVPAHRQRINPPDDA
jgi:nucleotide-binding universal stress UspA family protein